MSEKAGVSHTSVSIGGNAHGPIGIGNDITQTQLSAAVEQISTEELQAFRVEVERLRERAIAAAPGPLLDATSERMNELEQAVRPERLSQQGKKSLATLEYVRDWIADHLPQLTGSVIGLIVHPVLGKMVAAGGDMLVNEFKNRFDPS